MSQFNFGTPGTPGGGFSFGTPKTAASAAPAGFSFSSATTGGGFSFGTAAQNPASTQPAGLFSFAPPATSAQTSGFSFGTPATSAPAAAGNVFTLGGNAPKLNLSSTNTTQSAGITGALGLGSGGLGTSTPSSAPASQPVAPSGFVFGSNTATQPATTGGFSFGGMGATQAAAPSFSLGSIANTTQQAAPASTGLAFGVPASAAGPTTTTVSTAQPAVAFGLGAQTTGETPSPSPPPPRRQGIAVCWMQVCLLEPRVGVELWAAQLFRHPAHSSCLCRAPPSMTYAQLESLVNKWSLELEDQEKHFLQQATQVNAWDRKLIENGEKITSLHREVEKVKLDQKRLDQELDFILSQQKELEDLLVPLEESVKEQSGTVYLQHADEEREKTYKLAENIDAQLKRMAQDLKDIIEHLNTSGGPADTSDPLQQICKILNAHMDSLQWIDQNSALLQRKVEEVTKVCESRRKEQERSFRITFD
uniref:Nuclear pore glycoprotein p62 n=1 Tax=Podarcis muralis TaxID=64176 RepID=A0A670HNU1_PODMU